MKVSTSCNRCDKVCDVYDINLDRECVDYLLANVIGNTTFKSVDNN